MFYEKLKKIFIDGSNLQTHWSTLEPLPLYIYPFECPFTILRSRRSKVSTIIIVDSRADAIGQPSNGIPLDVINISYTSLVPGLGFLTLVKGRRSRSNEEAGNSAGNIGDKGRLSLRQYSYSTYAHGWRTIERRVSGLCSDQAVCRIAKESIILHPLYLRLFRLFPSLRVSLSITIFRFPPDVSHSKNSMAQCRRFTVPCFYALVALV